MKKIALIAAVSLSALLTSCLTDGKSQFPWDPQNTSRPQQNFGHSLEGIMPYSLAHVREPLVWGKSFVGREGDSLVSGFSKLPEGEVYTPTASKCSDGSDRRPSINYTAIYESKEDFEYRIASIDKEVDLLNPGKLMALNSWKFVTDVNRGVHIYDDANPANPVKVGFISIPGVIDIAMKNDALLANAYSALVSIDVRNPRLAALSDFVPGAFPPIYYRGQPIMDEDGQVVVAYTADTTWRCGGSNFTVDLPSLTIDGVKDEVDSRKPGSSTDPLLGVNASMSRFAISANWLYAVDSADMRLFDITNEWHPSKGSVVSIGANDVETIFRDGTTLFVGAMSGMHIFDHSSPGAPVYASTYEHVTSCDPVVVQDDIAYVTLRSGTACSGSVTNILDIIDVSDIRYPERLTTRNMVNPRGLAVDGNLLFVCDGSNGVVAFDVSTPYYPDLIGAPALSGIEGEDVLAIDGVLTVIGAEGVWRFSYSDPDNIRQLSFTPAG